MRATIVESFRFHRLKNEKKKDKFLKNPFGLNQISEQPTLRINFVVDEFPVRGALNSDQ